MKTIDEPARETPIAGEHDVIVCGAGSAGFVAATAAARAGARTLLIERHGILGGTATAAMMVEFGSIHDGARVIVGGITHEFLHRMDDFGGAPFLDADTHRMIFDPESMISVCREMVVESGAEVLLHSLIVGVVCEGPRVAGVIVENKTGRSAYLAGVVIDATGDGDVAAHAGAEFDLGRPGDGKMQPVTLEILLGNVDTTRFERRDVQELPDAIARAKAAGEWTIPTDQLFSAGRVVKRGAPDRPAEAFYFINGTNVLGVDGCLAEGLTRAELESRAQVDGLVAFFRKYVPGFENCYLDRTAAAVGIRETRRIRGDHTLTGAECLAATHFDDGIAAGHQSIDVHDVSGAQFEHAFLARGTHYEIPYRCLLPADLDLLVTGRCISVDHHALGSIRRMVTCMPLGEAAGLAAAAAAATGCALREVDVAALRTQLAATGHAIGNHEDT